MRNLFKVSSNNYDKLFADALADRKTTLAIPEFVTVKNVCFF